MITRIKVYRFLLSLLLITSLVSNPISVYLHKSSNAKMTLAAPSSFQEVDRETDNQSVPKSISRTNRAIHFLLTPATWQSFLVITTIILAIGWNAYFEEHKLVFLLPLAIFEGLLFLGPFLKKLSGFRIRNQGQVEEPHTKQRPKKIITLFLRGVLFVLPYSPWLFASAVFTPFFMDYISIQLFSRYELWGISFIITALTLRRLYLFLWNTVNLFLFLLEYTWDKKFQEEKRKPTFRSEKRWRTNTSVAALLSFILLGSPVMFAFAEFSKLQPFNIPLSFLSNSQKSYLANQQNEFLNYIGVKDVDDEYSIKWDKYKDILYYKGIFRNHYLSTDWWNDKESSILLKLMIPDIRAQLSEAAENSEALTIDEEKQLSAYAIYLAKNKILAARLEARKLFSSQDERRKKLAIYIWNQVPDPEAIPPLMELVRRSNQAHLYGRPLLRNYESADKETRRQILEIVVEAYQNWMGEYMGPSASQYLLPYVSDDEFELCFNTFIKRGFRDPFKFEPKVLLRIIKYRIKINDPHTQKYLKRLLNNPSDEARKMVFDLIEDQNLPKWVRDYCQEYVNENEIKQSQANSLLSFRITILMVLIQNLLVILSFIKSGASFFSGKDKDSRSSQPNANQRAPLLKTNNPIPMQNTETVLGISL